jgi:outer membrane protein assembly factor BamB
MNARFWLAMVAALSLPVAGSASLSVLTYHNSNLRHGAYQIHALTLAEAATMRPDTGFSAALNGKVYAQPLYWRPVGTKVGLVIAATESNAVYALNEFTGAAVWQRQLAASVPLSELPCGNIDPMGITGTPVIDPNAQVLYLDALTETGNGPRHLVYALSLADGSVLAGWPVDVEAQMTASGATFSSLVQGERSALLFFNNSLYVNYGGYAGDCGNYFGTVVQIDPNSAAITENWQTRAKRGGIWAQGGISGDGQFLYITTGNTAGATTWSDGEAIIRLRPGLEHSTRTRDFFTPSNWQDLDNSDKDLGGTEALPIDILSGGSRIRRVLAFGKDGNAYLADRADLGGIGGQIAVSQVSPSAIRTAPAVYETTTATMVAFTSANSTQCPGGNNITMLNVTGSAVSFAWCILFHGAGAPILTTTDGTANPIVWVVGAEGDNQLHGFNALNGQVVFSGAGTAMNGLHHYQTILATQRRFYVAADNTVYSFAFGP